MISRALFREAADALLSFSQTPHVAAALMARFDGRTVIELTDYEARELLRSVEWLRRRIYTTQVRT